MDSCKMGNNELSYVRKFSKISPCIKFPDSPNDVRLLFGMYKPQERIDSFLTIAPSGKLRGKYNTTNHIILYKQKV